MAKAASKNKDTFQQLYFWKKLVKWWILANDFYVLGNCKISESRSQITGEHWTVLLAVDGQAHFVQYCWKWRGITYGQGGK